MVVVALALVADLLLPPVTAAPPVPVAQPPAAAGAWYCPVTSGEQEAAVLSVASVGERPSQVTVLRYGDAGPVPDPPVAVAPGEPLDVALDAGQAARPVALRWQGGAVVATWRIEGEGGGAAPCEPAPSEHWHLTGFDTRLGAVATLHLFNPFAEDAVATVTFGTPEGRQTLVRTENVVIPAGQATRLALNELQPEVPDLGVNVQVLAGRLVSQGEIRFDPPGDDPGLTGRALLPAAPAPSLTASFGFARADDTTSSWLSVLNPAEREAAVRVQVSDPLDAGAALAEEISVPAGGVVRIDLAEASARPDFGVAVTSVNETPVVVARVVAIRTDQGSGVAASLGAAEPASEWALAGGGAGPRSGRVSLYNPGAEPVTAEVVAPGAPPAWSGIPLPPNGRATVELADAGPERASIPVRVRAGGPVTAELRSLGGAGGGQLWTMVGVPARRWTGPAARPAVRRDPSLRSQPLPTADPEPFLPTRAAPLPAEPVAMTPAAG